MDYCCPKCKADQVPHWITPSAEEMEGREWRCPNCHTTLLLLLGQVTVVHIPPRGGGSPLPPATPRR
jgi:DNA-directed RNA polymerase subunit RPC12/RpoP